MSRKPTVKLTDHQLWEIVSSPSTLSHRQVAELVGAEPSTVAYARRRPWICRVAYRRCAGCGQTVTVRDSGRNNDTAYHDACRKKVHNRTRRERRAQGLIPPSTPYVKAWRERNPLKSRIARDRERESAKQRRTPWDVEDAIQQIRDYDEEASITARARATRRRQPWSAYEDEYLLEHIDETAASLAEEMGRTLHAIRSRKTHLRKKHGLETFLPTEYVIPVREAAAEIGISVRALNRLLGSPRPVRGMVSFAEIEAIQKDKSVG